MQENNIETILSQAKLLIGGGLSEDIDPLLRLYIDLAREEVAELCGEGVDIPNTLLSQMVSIKYQRRGTESLTSSNYSGNGENYLKDYPPYILNRIEGLKKSKRKLRTL